MESADNTVARMGILSTAIDDDLIIELIKWLSQQYLNYFDRDSYQEVQNWYLMGKHKA